MKENKSLNRLETFSDGVFAIAITLLIFQIHYPPDGVEGSLWVRLLSLWPSYIAFALSFFVILVSWIAHQNLMHLVRGANRKVQLVYGFALLYVTFIPFATQVLADNLKSSEVSKAVVFYCGTFVVGSGTYNLMVETIAKSRLFLPEVDAETIRRIRRGYRITFSINVAATLLAFIIPYLALALNVAVRVFLFNIQHKNPSDSTLPAAIEDPQH